MNFLFCGDVHKLRWFWLHLNLKKTQSITFWYKAFFFNQRTLRTPLIIHIIFNFLQSCESLVKVSCQLLTNLQRGDHHVSPLVHQSLHQSIPFAILIVTIAIISSGDSHNKHL